jgi:quercetin dioxygenase-like cupin family protein
MQKFTKEEAIRPSEEMDPSRFSGRATGVPLFRGDARHQLNVTMVRFEAGVRNQWHRHTGGQVLHVVDGEGYVQSRGDELHRIGSGDTVSVAPDEVHWHGATDERPMAHLAINGGETVWLEPTEEKV